MLQLSRASVGVAAAAALLAAALVVMRMVSSPSSGPSSGPSSAAALAAARRRRRRETVSSSSPSPARPEPETPADETEQPEQTDDDDDDRELDAALRPMWSDPGGAAFRVRGPSYLSDHVKIPSGASQFRLDHVDLLETASAHYDICGTDARVRRRVERCSAGPDGKPGERAVLVLNLQIPGSPTVSIVVYWSAPGAVAPPADAPASADPADVRAWMLARLWHGDDAFRRARFKFVPTIVDGPLAVRAAVASKPVLLGRKLDLQYHRDGDRRLEIDIDVASSSVAAAITSVCRGAARHLAVNMAVVVQGEADNELPEQVVCSVCIAQLDLELRK